MSSECAASAFGDDGDDDTIGGVRSLRSRVHVASAPRRGDTALEP
ncbi:hypothetical protein [Natronococcus roseus]